MNNLIFAVTTFVTLSLLSGMGPDPVGAAICPGGVPCVDSNDIINGQVGNADLSANSVGPQKIRPDAVRGPDVLDGSLSGADIQDGSLTGTDIQDGTTTGVDIQDGTVTGADIQDGSVGSVDVDGSQLQLRILGVCADGSSIRQVNQDGTVLCEIDDVGAGGTSWNLLGNSGTTAGTHFLGTTDNQALEIKVNDTRVLRLEPDVTSSQIAPNIIGGHSGNFVASGAIGATIGGGGGASGFNIVTQSYGTIGGGNRNRAGLDVPPGAAFGDTVAGGSTNTASGGLSTVGGGANNVASGAGSVVAGGSFNAASATSSSVGGGSNNVASGVGSTVVGGSVNTASGGNSFAAGNRANANLDGCFVWGDMSSNNVFNCDIANGTAFRSAGGFYIYTNPSLTTGAELHVGSGTWSTVSDRNVKENFALVDGREILGRLASIPIETWNYKTQETTIRHIGPMAQDFRAAFGVGEDDRHITTVDADGVALAAIQALYRILQDKEKEIAQLKAEITELRTEHVGELTALKEQISRLQGLVQTTLAQRINDVHLSDASISGQ